MQLELARQRAAAVIDALRREAGEHRLAAAPHGCKHPAIGARRLVRIMPEPLVRRGKGAAGVKDVSGVRMAQLRKVSRLLIDHAASSGMDLRVGLVW